VAAAWVLVALAAPLLAPEDPLAQTSPRFLPPSGSHLFGTDEIGRDVLSRVLYGARISLPLALLLVALAMTVGAILGGVAGYFGGWIDEVDAAHNPILTELFASFTSALREAVFDVSADRELQVDASPAHLDLAAAIRAGDPEAAAAATSAHLDATIRTLKVLLMSTTLREPRADQTPAGLFTERTRPGAARAG
jgi:FCD domain